MKSKLDCFFFIQGLKFNNELLSSVGEQQQAVVTAACHPLLNSIGVRQPLGKCVPAAQKAALQCLGISLTVFHNPQWADVDPRRRVHELL